MLNAKGPGGQKVKKSKNTKRERERKELSGKVEQGKFFLRILGGFRVTRSFPGGSDDKESACNPGDPGLIPISGRSPGEENGNTLYSLAWTIPWTEEPDGPQSMGLQRAGHGSATSNCSFTWKPHPPQY